MRFVKRNEGVDTDPVVWRGIHVDINGNGHVYILVELSIAETTQHGSFVSSQLGGFYRQSCRHNAAHTGGKAVDGVRLIDARAVGAEGYRQTLRLICHLGNSLLNYIAIEGDVRAVFHNGLNALEVYFPFCQRVEVLWRCQSSETVAWFQNSRVIGKYIVFASA